MRTRARAFSLVIKDLDTLRSPHGPCPPLNPQVRRSPSTTQWPCTGAQGFAAMRSYLSTAAKHGRRPFDVLTELTNGNVWIPATTWTVTAYIVRRGESPGLEVG